MASNTTKERILKVAERLFAEHGLDGTSLRTITSEAGVNLAAVNYHFGSKDGLISAAFERWVLPLNAARLRGLTAFEAAANGAPLTVEQIMEAFIAPIFEAAPRTTARERALFLRLIGRAYSEPGADIRELYLKDAAEVGRRYVAALRRALPDLSEPEILWRLHFIVGTLSHALLATGFLKGFMDMDLDVENHENLKTRLVNFCCAGMRAAANQKGVAHV